MREIPKNQFDADDRDYAKLHDYINEYLTDPNEDNANLINQQLDNLEAKLARMSDIPTPADARELHQFHRGTFYRNWERRFHQLGQIGVIAIPNTTFEEWMVYFQEWANAFVDDYNEFQTLVDEVIRILYGRHITVDDTASVDMTIVRDWKTGLATELKSDVNISKKTINDCTNSITIQDDGLFAPDYLPMIKHLQDEIDNINKEIDNIKNDINNIHSDINNIKNDINDIKNTINGLSDGLHKVIDNLRGSGAWQGDDKNGGFVEGRNIATGNVNVFTSVQDGSSFIRTNSGSTENDVALTEGK